MGLGVDIYNEGIRKVIRSPALLQCRKALTHTGDRRVARVLMIDQRVVEVERNRPNY